MSRGAQRVRNFPLCTSKAANSETVPWSTYSTVCRSGCHAAGERRAACGPAFEWRSFRRCRIPLLFLEKAARDQECLSPWPQNPDRAWSCFALRARLQATLGQSSKTVAANWPAPREVIETPLSQGTEMFSAAQSAIGSNLWVRAFVCHRIYFVEFRRAVVHNTDQE
jgi:hypothetical protein